MKKKLDAIIFVVIVIAISFLMVCKPFTFSLINGNSMYPTLKNGDLLFLMKQKIERNSIVVFKPNENWKTEKENLYIKRVIAIPNDKLKIEDKKLYVNEELIYNLENYPKNIENIEYTLQENEYFVVGDNYKQSNDSLFNIDKGIHFSLITRKQITYSTKGDYKIEQWKK